LGRQSQNEYMYKLSLNRGLPAQHPCTSCLPIQPRVEFLNDKIFRNDGLYRFAYIVYGSKIKHDMFCSGFITWSSLLIMYTSTYLILKGMAYIFLLFCRMHTIVYQTLRVMGRLSLLCMMDMEVRNSRETSMFISRCVYTKTFLF